jgi:hypothetical protein
LKRPIAALVVLFVAGVCVVRYPIATPLSTNGEARVTHSWIADALPEFSNFILVLAGLILCIPEWAEWAGKHKVVRYSFAAGCLVLGGVVFVSSYNQQRQETSDMTTLITSTNNLVVNTNADVVNTNEMVTAFGILMPQVNALNARMADLDKKIEANKGNPSAIAELQSQLAEAQTQKTNLSRAMAVSMAPGILDQLRQWAEKWNNDDQRLDVQMRQTIYPTMQSPEPPASLVQEATQLRQSQRANLNDNYTRQILPILTSANNLREALLQGSQLTESDRSIAAIFDSALSGRPLDWLQMNTLSNYMNNLVSSQSLRDPAKP